MAERTKQTGTGTPAGWKPDPNDPRRLRWWDGSRWHDLTVPNPSRKVENPPARDSLAVQLKAVPLSFWAALGFGAYLLVALAIAGATEEEAGSFGMALVVALIGLALLLAVYVLPVLLIGGFVVWTIYSAISESRPSREERRERRRADRAARQAGLPTQRKAKRHERRESRLTRARRSIR